MTLAEDGVSWVIAPSVPVANAVAIAKVSALPSASAPTSVIVTAVSSLVVAVPAVAIGASLTGTTSIATVTAAEAPVPSLTWNVNASSHSSWMATRTTARSLASHGAAARISSTT